MKRIPILIVTVILLLLVQRVKAQQGIGTNTPDKSAAVDILSNSRGLLIPRVNLTSTTVAAPILTPVADALMVYNLNTAGDITPGFYYWKKDLVNPANSKWVRLATANEEPWYNVLTNTGATANTQNIYQMGKVGINTATPAYHLDVNGMLNQIALVDTLSGRIGSIHSGNNLIGAGIKGVGMTSKTTTGPLGYLFTGDATATGGSANQSGLGLIDFSTNNNATFQATINPLGNYQAQVSTNNGAPNTDGAGTLWTLNQITNTVTNGTNTNEFFVNPTSIASVAYPNYRNDTTTTAPINFLYTDNAGKFLSAPLSTLTNNSWNILGNTGTNSVNHFLGTTDNQDLKFRVNNQQVAWFGSETGSISGSIFLGQGAGLDATGNQVREPYYSYFIGANAGHLTAKPSEVNAFGHQAGESSTGSYANFIGARAGANALGAQSSNFVGYEAGSTAIAAANSNFIGTAAGQNSTNAANAIFIGTNAGAGDVLADSHLTNNASTILLGNNTHTAGFSNSIALGTGATNTAADQFMIGSTTGTLYDIVNPKYPNTRNDVNTGIPANDTPIQNVLYTNAAGKFLSAPLSSVATEPWFVEGTANKATDNTQNIYQMGNVGINLGGAASSLTDKLTINTTNTNEGMTITGSSPFIKSIRFTNLDNTGQGNIDWYKSGTGGATAAAIRTVGNDSYAVKGLGFFTGNFNDDTTPALERMRIDKDGKVSIGNSLATNQLHVTATSDPVRFEGLQASNDVNDLVVLTTASGVLKTTSAATFTQDLRKVGLSNHITQDAGVGGNGTSAGSGAANIGIGNGTLAANTTGNSNIAIGQSALAANTTGIENVALGGAALTVATGNYNTAIGVQSLFSTTTGDQNTAVGRAAMSNNTTGGLNTALGMYSLIGTTSGSGNVAVGYYAGKSLTSGNNNIFIGNGADFNISATNSNQLNIGNWIYGDNRKIGIGKAIPTNTLEVQSAAANTSGLTFTNLNNASPVTAVAAPLGVDATGKVVTIAASTSAAIRTETANYTALLTDETILVDASTGSKVITLPAASAANKGKRYNVKKIAGNGSNTVNVISLGGNIDDNVAATGVTGHLIYQGWTFQSDGTNWYIISRI